MHHTHTHTHTHTLIQVSPTNFDAIHSDLILVPKLYDLETKFFIADLIKYAATPPNQPR